jgi:hypothetical protein
MEFDKGEIYKVVNKDGNEFVGFAYKPNIIQKFINLLPMASSVIQLLPIRLNEKISTDIVARFMNTGTAFSEKEIEELIKLK